jgi:small-conductance mechanosensitive channel
MMIVMPRDRFQLFLFPSSFASPVIGWLLSVLLALQILGSIALAQQSPGGESDVPSSPAEHSTQIADRVEIQAVSTDAEIDRRLTGILQATDWFSKIEVTVDEGVVFLDGRTETEEYRSWAGSLAGKTNDVVAVVNRIRLAERSLWDFSPAIGELKNLWDLTLQRLPRLGLGLAVLILVGIAAKLVALAVRRILSVRLQPLLRDVAARILSVLIFLVGCYLVLQIAGLSGLAATVLGGTGLVGLVAGIAFRDILENYLASILISLRNPFRIGDVVEIEGHTGIVLKVTTRGTVLMNLDGNHVQIPNATVYKSIIRNYTANPNRRETFEVGIGFDNDTASAQKIALEALDGHPAVLKDPEAQVLVDRLGSATVNLKFYYWYDGLAYDWLKVRSSLIRKVMRVFEERGISMPDEAREVIFPDGVQVRMLESPPTEPAADREPAAREEPDQGEKPAAEPEQGETVGDLASEDAQLREQARKSRVPEEGESLIEESSP